MIRTTITLFLAVFALMCEAQTFEYNGGIYSPVDDTEFGKSVCLVAFQGAIPENGELVMDSQVFKSGEEEAYHVTEIGDNVLRDISTVKSIVFPENLLEIKSSNIANMESLEKVTFGNRLKYIWEATFINVPRLKEVSFPKSLEFIEEFSFDNVGLINLEIVSGMIPIHHNYCHLNDLETLEIKSNGFIGFGCLSDLPKIRRVEIPEECYGVGGYSFDNLPALEEIVFPDRADFLIYSDTFTHCPSVKRIYCYGTVPPTISPADEPLSTTDATQCLDFKNITLYVPFGAKETYESNPLWNVYGSIREFDPAGIHAAETSGPDSFVRSVAGGIVIDNPRGETVTVSDMNGRSASYNGCSAVSLESGAYIVTLGAKSTKVIVK